VRRAGGAARPSTRTPAPSSYDSDSEGAGRKRDFTSLPYHKIQSFSVETAGTFDLDAELDRWFSGLGKVRLEFKGSANIQQLGHMIASYVL
jgi:hypothetical protein